MTSSEIRKYCSCSYLCNLFIIFRPSARLTGWRQGTSWQCLSSLIYAVLCAGGRMSRRSMTVPIMAGGEWLLLPILYQYWYQYRVLVLTNTYTETSLKIHTATDIDTFMKILTNTDTNTGNVYKYYWNYWYRSQYLAVCWYSKSRRYHTLTDTNWG